MVSPLKMLTLGRSDASIALHSLNRIFHGIRFFATSYIGWPTSRILSLNPAAHFLLIDCVFLCRDSAIQANLTALAAPSIDTAKIQRIIYTSKFCPSIWGDFQHEFDEFERNAISSPRIRNFRAFEITCH
jgi:hypothetical protein